ncbi:uncharacterized protein BO95DRAFT_23201 [Aspergillus brunneoviolaceus CBS 621.78]|uniref:Uncharacterized protein n=1 Tax=Aspergillus brunneoviolaceus CBS 621.78 TaxID=1450534 RepID=A0ACD1FT50_9EURO|nr:hypothetical protein BO95DRAFT_23201 [Aspergillus brunneoviolaceus CBS 621.78]RAH40134.1 hypothetical protein BO95DRAFT_23201 [Aspergillus brunneoviolaceus CBS 621.78]
MESAVTTSVAHDALLSPVSGISRSLASTPSDTHSQTSCASETVSQPPRVSSECVQSNGTANLGDVTSCTACTRLCSEQRSAKPSRKTAPVGGLVLVPRHGHNYTDRIAGHCVTTAQPVNPHIARTREELPGVILSPPETTAETCRLDEGPPREKRGDHTPEC